MDIEYRPADCKAELEPLLRDFLEHYDLKGTSSIRVDASIVVLSTPGIMIFPQKGSTIEEICTKDTPPIGQLVRSQKSYATIDIPQGRCVVHYESSESWCRA